MQIALGIILGIVSLLIIAKVIDFFSNKELVCMRCGHIGDDYFTRKKEYTNNTQYRCKNCGSQLMIDKENALSEIIENHYN